MFRSTAHIYDLIYELAGKDYAAESVVLADQIRSRCPGAATLLDVACGTGGHLVHLRNSFDVTGVDLDPGMLEVARGRLPGVELIEADMRAFDAGGRFDAVVCLFSSIGYMPDDTALGAAIGCMARHLETGGVLVVDGWVRPDAWSDAKALHLMCGERDGLAVSRLARSERRGDRTILEMHHLAGTPEGVEHLVDVHELTLFGDGEYRAAFEAADLEVEVVGGPMGADRDRYIGTPTR